MIGRELFISFFLDTRRKLKSKKYPVKLRVYSKYPRRQKLYPTRFEFSKEEFESIWETIKPRNEVKVLRAEFQALLDKAEKVANELHPFTFEAFEEALYQKAGLKENVLSWYDEAIGLYKQAERYGTASNYECSKNSIICFVNDIKGKKPEVLLFREISKDFLVRYENYMVRKGNSLTTVGIYLRPLRALFNAAIASRAISIEIYPFGTRKYVIPAPRSVKKALNRHQLKALFDAKAQTEGQKKAKGFFFFLYNCAGLNVKDMLRLRFENLQGDRLIYFREKTKRTTKTDLKPVVVYLNDFAINFINQYGNSERLPGNYVFPVYSPQMTEAERFKESLAFTREINQHLKGLAKVNGLPVEISTYWSRHTFATNAIRSGASLEQISQALNHHNIVTTKSYFAGFEDETMRKISDNLMNF